MTYPAIKTSLKIGIGTSIAIMIYLLANVLLAYGYFRFDYFVTTVATVFLITGFLLSKSWQMPIKNSPSLKSGLLTLHPQSGEY